MFPSWRARRRYLKRSSKACRPDLVVPAAFVSRSTVVRGFQSVQSLRASFTEILAAIGCRHCSRAPGSKNVHCIHAWSSAPHLPHRALLTSALDSSPAQRAHRMTSRHCIRFRARGPSGWSARGRGFCARGARGVFRPSSWYPRCRYFWSDIAQSRPRSRALLQPAPARGRRAVSRACLCGGVPELLSGIIYEVSAGEHVQIAPRNRNFLPPHRLVHLLLTPRRSMSVVGPGAEYFCGWPRVHWAVCRSAVASGVSMA